MKKLMTTVAACALASAVFAQVESVNIVGYASVDGIAGKSIVASSFIDVGSATDVINIQSLMTGNFAEDDAIAFYVGGAWSTYLYSYTCDDGVAGTYNLAGWHTGDYILSQANVSLGAAFFITPVSGTRSVTLAGEVKKTTPVIALAGGGTKTLVGIGRPLTVAINSLTVTGLGEDDAMAFYEAGAWSTYLYSFTCDDGVAGTYTLTGWHTGDYILTADQINTAAGFFVTKYSAGSGTLKYTLEL